MGVLRNTLSEMLLWIRRLLTCRVACVEGTSWLERAELCSHTSLVPLGQPLHLLIFCICKVRWIK